MASGSYAWADDYLSADKPGAPEVSFLIGKASGAFSARCAVLDQGLDSMETFEAAGDAEHLPSQLLCKPLVSTEIKTSNRSPHQAVARELVLNRTKIGDSC
jgi:hypothetical protein